MDFKNTNLKNIHIPNPAKTLFILGNGFDRAHHVRSAYTDFRDSLGKNSDLRQTMEMYITTDTLWSDFEEALAYIDTSAMYNSADFWLDDFGAYEDDAQASQFFAAIDAATTPIYIIQTELPRRFRKWVNSLVPLSKDKPFLSLINPDSRFLVFNYTEFVEDIYSVDVNNICYIHGCRKNKDEELVLGHSGAYEGKAEMPRSSGQTNYDALNHISWRVSDYYEDTRKHSRDIIKSHSRFFNSLDNVDTVVTLGHSLAKVDYDYFSAIISNNPSPQNLKWYISFHTADDVSRAEAFVLDMGLAENNVTLFRV